MVFDVCLNGIIQWRFQVPKLEVPAICKAYVRGYAPQNMALDDIVPPFYGPEMSIE